ncbi:MAG: MBL fold metallo-hydrolase, partial [Candidatus Hydrogenedentales bacterium]
MQRREPGTVITVDCHYRAPESAAAYLIVEDGQAAIVDTNTALAVPMLLRAIEEQGLTPDCVRYVVVTHAHLDHCGGAAALLKHCTKAKVLCHPRAERHLVDPARLVESALRVYGRDVFDTLYGCVEPIRPSRVKPVEDGKKLRFGKRTLLFLHTPGHAKHHIAVIDLASGSAFTGDAFGMHYPSIQHGSMPYIYFSSPPTDFDPQAARASAQRILDSGADRLCLSHFGIVTEVA